MTRWRVAAWATVVLALLAVFASYLRPGIALTLATQLWNCI